GVPPAQRGDHAGTTTATDPGCAPRRCRGRRTVRPFPAAGRRGRVVGTADAPGPAVVLAGDGRAGRTARRHGPGRAERAGNRRTEPGGTPAADQCRHGGVRPVVTARGGRRRGLDVPDRADERTARSEERRVGKEWRSRWSL